MTIRLWVKSAVLAVSAAFLLAVPASANVAAVSGSAFGVQATGLINVAATPSVTLPAAGSNGVALTDTVASLSVGAPPLAGLTTGIITVSTNGSTTGSGFATSFSQVNNLGLGLLGLGLTATSVRSDCSATSAGSTASTTLENAVLSPGPISLAANPAPNTIISLTLPGVGTTATVTLNEQIPVAGPGVKSVTVNAIHVRILVLGILTQDVIVAQSHCDIGAPTAVKLRTFSAAPTNKGVMLHWKTAAEVQTLGFNVYRQQGTKLVKVNAKLIAAHGITSPGHSYSLVDRHVSRAPVVRYRLQEVQQNGSRVWLARTSLAS